jgi:NAD(P)-dependent dehydrogenase (short-subunit alcohol dehydrogenase family)
MGVLAGQVAFVTGCARRSGLGAAIALELARAGADLALVDVARSGSRNAGESVAASDADGLERLADEIRALGRRVWTGVGDVGDARDVEQMVGGAVDALGRIDTLVNNAAAPHGADRAWTWDVPPEAFELVMRTNTTGPFLVSSAVVRHLLGRDAEFGRIVNIASAAGRRGLPQRAAYCASKFALVGLTQVLAVELADRRITVNAVCPGAIATARHDARLERQRSGAPDASTAMLGLPPVGHVGSPDDVARAVLFLVDPSAGFITGQIVGVDGGFVMG